MGSRETMTEAPAVVQQTQLEFETLGHIKKALQGAVRTDVAGSDPSRKLANVRFVTASLQRYVERLFALEEHDGYMTELTETHPHLRDQISRLLDEHRTLRGLLGRIVVRLELLTIDQAGGFEALCKELQAFMGMLDRHAHMEIQLLEDAYLQDTGGEGGV